MLVPPAGLCPPKHSRIGTALTQFLDCYLAGGLYFVPTLPHAEEALACMASSAQRNSGQIFDHHEFRGLQ